MYWQSSRGRDASQAEVVATEALQDFPRVSHKEGWNGERAFSDN